MHIGDFSVAIRNISKDKYKATVIKRSEKSVYQANIAGLRDDVSILESIMEWRLISERELELSESPNGTLVSQGTTQWTIKRRSILAGIYQVKFTASITIGDVDASQILTAFDYGFLKVVKGPVRAIIDGGSKVRWSSSKAVTVDGSLSYDADIGPGNHTGVNFTWSFDYGFLKVVKGPVRAIIDGGSKVRWSSSKAVTVDGSLSYDADIGPGNHTGVNFTWSCYDPVKNFSLSNDCFGSFVGESNLTAVRIDPKRLTFGNKTYVLRLTVSKDDRSDFAEMSFEIAANEIPQISLRYVPRFEH